MRLAFSGRPGRRPTSPRDDRAAKSVGEKSLCKANACYLDMGCGGEPVSPRPQSRSDGVFFRGEGHTRYIRGAVPVIADDCTLPPLELSGVAAGIKGCTCIDEIRPLYAGKGIIRCLNFRFD